jgi:hypothetical protein
LVNDRDLAINQPQYVVFNQTGLHQVPRMATSAIEHTREHQVMKTTMIPSGYDKGMRQRMSLDSSLCPQQYTHSAKTIELKVWSIP